ncbi:polyadenylate-binding protein, cytoplasmic and nuclear-like [Helianthus annuus]|uniref:polyadenylate-binding protein, cytoplasmic and nuclear-like n=1 Tax=Helianthus annuus TaxID=4232 RepID=UPI00165316BF|nr:polyadenylate-binding protein, cytoplasmic and nuclear-like [Helianthus annuus]
MGRRMWGGQDSWRWKIRDKPPEERDKTVDEEEWETIRSKKGKEKKVEEPSTTIFLTNLPEEVSDKEIWLEVRRCGYLSDVYFPRKKDLKGKRFSFARFKKIRDINKLVQALNNIWFGEKRVKANVSKFKRDEEKEDGGNKYSNGGRQERPSKWGGGGGRYEEIGVRYDGQGQTNIPKIQKN